MNDDIAARHENAAQVMRGWLHQASVTSEATRKGYWSLVSAMKSGTAKETTKKSTWFNRRAALRFAAAETCRQRFPEISASLNGEVSAAPKDMMKTIEWLVRSVEAYDRTRPKSFARRESARADLAAAPADWFDRLFGESIERREKMADVMDKEREAERLAMAVICVAAGVRPGEFSAGVAISLQQDGQVRIEINGLKNRKATPLPQGMAETSRWHGGYRASRGRGMRVIEVMPPDTSAGAYLKELAQANIKFKTKGVRAFGQWFSRRCGQVGMSLSCYAARHAFASEQKARLPRSISTPSAFESLIERDASNLIADARAETHAAQIADSLGHASDRTQDFYGAAGLAGKGGGFKTISASAEGKPRMSRTKARASASAILSPAGSPSLATADCDELPGDSLKLKP